VHFECRMKVVSIKGVPCCYPDDTMNYKNVNTPKADDNPLIRKEGQTNNTERNITHHTKKGGAKRGEKKNQQST